ncbi:protein kinase, ATP binding site-containing protein [Tanacetum coccineum]|uniref:Protein kinase, ATP binding site-containing protein n=1 Tax=Tanacetum coccineum TaxID=301880 RepID=A0ABQ4XHY8_9ASTR
MITVQPSSSLCHSGGVDDGDSEFWFMIWLVDCRSLDEYLRQESNEYFSWAERLEICVGIAKGLNYLHSGVEEANENRRLRDALDIHLEVIKVSALKQSLRGAGRKEVAEFNILKIGGEEGERRRGEIRGGFRLLRVSCIEWGERWMGGGWAGAMGGVGSNSSTFYRGDLHDHWQYGPVAIKRFEDFNSFKDELKIVSRLQHKSIIPFIGYCDDGGEKFLIYERADNGSLSTYLPELTWAQRLKICIGAAKGLKYLHSGLGEYESIIHGDFSSQNILVSENLKAKICGLGSSFLVPRNNPDTKVYKKLVGRQEMDPVYRESYIPKVESNVYSLGVVLFEILTGKLVNTECRTQFDEAHLPKIIQNEEHNNNKKNRGFLQKLTLRHKFPWVSWDPSGPTVVRSRDPRGPTLVESLTKCDGDEELNLMALVRCHYGDGFKEFIDPQIRDEIDVRSLHICKEIAYKCISYQIKDRPSLNKIIKRLEEASYIQNHRAPSTVTGQGLQHQKLEDFRIPLMDINSAIGVKGPETKIGDGGFGVVYKGQPLEHWQNRIVAIKCLHPESYQGEYEFRNELNMIYSFSHENIIPFIGYCDEGNEKIIVYEYASEGSLDCHLKDKKNRHDLTWELRLKICLGAARGLDYLHSGLGENNRVIHRDVKSANILLDHNFVAKVCDFGLSKYGPTNQPQTQVYTNAAGTNFYMDPIYHESGVLRKESDVYSFGVVMFELLSGMLAHHQRRIGDDKRKPLINLVRRYYDYRPDLLVDPLIKDEIDNRSFNAFREVAFQCISYNSKERPTMEAIADRVEEALELQVPLQPLSDKMMVRSPTGSSKRLASIRCSSVQVPARIVIRAGKQKD